MSSTGPEMVPSRPRGDGDEPGQPALPAPRAGFGDHLLVGAVVVAALLVFAVTTLLLLRQRRGAAESVANNAVAARQLIDFTLTDRTGRTVRRAELDGQFLVVNFVFTGCSVSCLQVNHRMAEIQRLTADRADVRLVSLTVDPRSDTPASLAKFAGQFGADTNRWLFLTGDERAMRAVIATSFLGEPDPAMVGLMPGGFGHVDHIAVVDRRGRLRSMVNGLHASAPRVVLDTLTRLEREAPGK